MFKLGAKPKLRVFLCGMMAAGKSTVGRLVADQLDWQCIDLDHEIEKYSEKKIALLFEEHGEAWFRRRERRLLKIVSKPEQRVIALGGGAVIDSRNRKLMNKKGQMIYLRARVDTLAERITGEDRPLIADRDKKTRKQKIADLLAQREAFYSQAQAVVDVDNKATDAVAREVLSHIQL